ncbi:MAG: hypothetical protein WBP93_13915 [Pyrinomonadaceae bacterium]
MLESTAAEAANIGPREQRKRRVMGIVALAAGAALVFVLVAWNEPRWLRLFVFFPIWIAALGFFQAKEKTCIALAARGVCNMDQGEENIEDEQVAAELRARARRINRRSLMAAIVVTMVALAFPQ